MSKVLVLYFDVSFLLGLEVWKLKDEKKVVAILESEFEN